MNKILVLGDTCIDVNYYGNIKRISPEAPIPIFEILSRESKPGMAENVASNVENAGNNVILYTKDTVRFDNDKTIKNRYFVGNHYCYRIDQDETSNLCAEEAKMILDILEQQTTAKVIILQDYNKGFFDRWFIADIINTIRKSSPNVTIIADGYKSREPLFYMGVDYLKLNEDEYATLSKNGDIFKVPTKALIITKGEKGAVLKYPDRSNKHFDAFKVETKDVTGAGDTFTAWFASEIANGKSEEEAMITACKAASISVQHLGCYAPSVEEVK